MNFNVDDRRFMETENVPRLLARFAVPAMVGMIASAIYNIVDRVFVGHMMGPDGIAAIALGFPCMLLCFALAVLVGVGGASRTALQLGAKNEEGAMQTVGSVVFLCLAGSLLFMTIGKTAAEFILRMSGASDALLPASKEYLSIILWGVPFATLSFAGSCVIRACGSPKYAMGTQLVGAVLNIILDAWFVVWLRMEIRGAALATVISQGISVLWVAGYFFSPYARIRLRGCHVSAPDRETVGRILAVGAPPFLMHLTFVLIHGLINVSVSRYGGDLAVSSMGIIISLDSLLFMPAVAIGEGTQPIVGYNYGARCFNRVRLTIKWAVGAATAFYILSFSAIYFNTTFLVRMFNRSDHALIDLTSRAMRVAYLGIPVMGLSIVTGFALQGLGRARDSFVLSFIRFGLLLLLPLAVLPRFLGLFGVWMTFPLSDIAGSAVSFLYLRRVMMEMKNADAGENK